MIGRTGVCSWSLRPRDPSSLARDVRAAGLGHVQLALGPLRDGRWSLAATRRALEEADVALLSGMIGTLGEDYTTPATILATGGFRVDANWKANRAAAADGAKIARELGLDLVTLHAGFLADDRADPERARIVARLGEVADLYADAGLRIGFETGQEGAATLAAVLDELDRPNLGVNFDPANLLLYGTGEPVAALRALLPRVLQLHVKDARPPARAGEWGSEVAVGDGEVDWDAFFALVAGAPRALDLVVEREAGVDRVADVARAARRVAAAREEHARA